MLFCHCKFHSSTSALHGANLADLMGTLILKPGNGIFRAYLSRLHAVSPEFSRFVDVL